MSYPPFSVTADVAVFSREGSGLGVVLIERGRPPFQGSWALPGGFVDIDEDLVDAAVRELAEETGLVLAPHDLHQLGAYGSPNRDPRGRVVSVVFWAVADDLTGLSGGSDARSASLVPLDEALDDPARLAFDHQMILEDAAEAVSGSLAR